MESSVSGRFAQWAPLRLPPITPCNRRRAALAGDRDPPSDDRRTAGCPDRASSSRHRFMPRSVARCMEGMASLH